MTIRYEGVCLGPVRCITPFGRGFTPLLARESEFERTLVVRHTTNPDYRNLDLNPV